MFLFRFFIKIRKILGIILLGFLFQSSIYSMILVRTATDVLAKVGPLIAVALNYFHSSKSDNPNDLKHKTEEAVNTLIENGQESEAEELLSEIQYEISIPAIPPTPTPIPLLHTEDKSETDSSNLLIEKEEIHDSRKAELTSLEFRSEVQSNAKETAAIESEFKKSISNLESSYYQMHERKINNDIKQASNYAITFLKAIRQTIRQVKKVNYNLELQDQKDKEFEKRLQDPVFKEKCRILKSKCFELAIKSVFDNNYKSRQVALLRLNQIVIESPFGRKFSKLTQLLNNVYCNSNGSFKSYPNQKEATEIVVDFLRNISPSKEQYLRYLQKAQACGLTDISGIIKREDKRDFKIAQESYFTSLFESMFPKTIIGRTCLPQEVVLSNPYNKTKIQVLTLLEKALNNPKDFPEIKTQVGKILDKLNSQGSNYQAVETWYFVHNIFYQVDTAIKEQKLEDVSFIKSPQKLIDAVNQPKELGAIIYVDDEIKEQLQGKLRDTTIEIEGKVYKTKVVGKTDTLEQPKQSTNDESNIESEKNITQPQESGLSYRLQKYKLQKKQSEGKIGSISKFPQPDDNDPEKEKQKTECSCGKKCYKINGKYEDAPYHHNKSQGQKSPAPKDGQTALDHSVLIDTEGKLPQRIGLSESEIVVLYRTREGVYHGHVRSWNDLTGAMRKALYEEGWIKNPKTGKINFPKWAKGK